jgi:CheY-like chemotaxis protein
VTAPARGRHVLVADDDDVIRMLARVLLEHAGMRVTDARDGSEALALLRRDNDFAVVLLDLDMPNVGGMEVLEWIRGAPSASRLPVLILTGSEVAADTARAMAAGADGCIRKPIVASRLLAEIITVMGGRDA